MNIQLQILKIKGVLDIFISAWLLVTDLIGIGLQTWKFGKFREMIHCYRVCTPCRSDKTNFCFPEQILAETTPKRW